MASVLLTAAGAALGAGIPGIGWLAGPLLGMAGGMLGGGIDASLGLTPTANVSGARLASIKMQDSREGAAIPRLYGTMRLAGNVIWSSDLIETYSVTKVGGGKGGSARATNYHYSVNLAVGICAGPVAGLLRIWADSKLIYDARLNTTYANAVRFYKGTSTQTADALLQASLGAGNTPAYRGTAYVVIERLNLEHFGNRIPNLTFEIEGISGGFTPASLAHAAHSAASWTGSENARRALVTGPNTLVVPGVAYDSGAFRFVAEHYTFADGALTRSARITSPALTVTGNHNYALSPDGRYIACINADSSNGELVLYNVRTQTFGTIIMPVLDYLDSYAYVTIAWVDDTAVVVSAHHNGEPAVLLFTRAGNALVNAGAPPATVLYSGGAVTDFWHRVEPAWFLGTLTLYLHNGTSTSLAVARLQMQNGALHVSALPPVSLGAGLSYILPLFDDTVLVATSSGINTSFRTYAVTASGLSISRAATALTIDNTTIEDMLALPGGRIACFSNISGVYTFAEVTLTDTSFVLSGTPTAVAGAPTPSVSLATLRRFGGSHAAVLTDDRLAVMTARRGDNTLAGIMTDICAVIGVSALDVSAAGTDRVPGYALTDVMTARDALENLQNAYPFTLIESDAQLKATAFASSSVTTLNTAALRASSTNDVPPAIAYSRTQAQEMPTAVQLDYLDSALDYNSASRIAARHAPPFALVARLGVPLALDATTAQRMADVRLARLLAEQSSITLCLSRQYAALDAGDCITIAGDTYRITTVSERGGVITLDAVRQVAGTLSAATTLALGSTGGDLVQQSAQLLALDLPALTDDANQPGVYFAALAAPGWRGGIVYRSVNSETPTEYARLGAIATAGIAVDALVSGPHTHFDDAATVTVAISHGILQSASELAVLNGTNAALLGAEIIQFQNATLIGDNIYKLSRLLRGRRGTEGTIGSHAAGERFLLLDAASLLFVPESINARGQTVALQLATIGQTLAESLPFNFMYDFHTLKPFAPTSLLAVRDAGTNTVTFSWLRRARVNGEWLDYSDVPLDETAESYVVEVTDGYGTVLRTFTPTATSQTYSSAQQNTDFGGLPSDITFRVTQVSPRYGRGHTAEATITL